VSAFYFKKVFFRNSCSLSIVTENNVLKYLNKLSASKATGLDGISSRFVSDGASIICCPLTHVINLSIIQGVVPDDFKAARVVPLYKKGNKNEVGNYRPVSILCIVTKILERIVYDQVENYLNKQKLLYEFQSGFRKSFSTDTCLIHLSDYIRFNLDKGNYVGMVLLDLQKAFDTVDHFILFDKLKMIGFSPDVIRWFESYLSSRKQCTDVSGIQSSLENVTCGVPQGSILGPLLFLIYVNDMAGVVNNKLLLYADDSAILVSGESKHDIECLLAQDLERVSHWLVDNKLSLHLGKTESILFGSKPKLKKESNLNISCNGTVIQHTDSVKYLGATLDQCLSFESMVTSVIKKANARLKFLYRKQRFLSFDTKKMLIMSLIQCHFDYTCSIWYYGISQNLKNRLQVTQNKIIRFIFRLDPRCHINKEYFLQLGWLPVEKKSRTNNS